jgi:hypothetical protein
MSYIKNIYDELLKQVTNHDTNINYDVDRTCVTITNIHKHLPKSDAEYHYNVIGSLIIHHKFITDKMETIIYPYDAQIMAENKGILGDINKLPPLLQQIIAQYIENNSLK